MNTNTPFRAQMAAGLFLLCASAFAADKQVQIAWAHAVIGNPSSTTGPEIPGAVVGPPDGKTYGLPPQASLYVLNFNSFKGLPTVATPYDLEKLQELLGEPIDLKDWDLIAFEGNGNRTKGWESCLWLVTDQRQAAAGTFSGDALNPDQSCCRNTSVGSPLKFRSGTISRAAYESFFSAKLPANGEWASWILVDVPGDIDVNSDRFRIFVTGALIGTNHSPDPDAFGVIRH